MEARELVNGAGATNRHPCPNCALDVRNVSRGAKTTGWIVYRMASVVCSGDGFKHYKWRGFDFLWLAGEASPDVGQLKLL